MEKLNALDYEFKASVNGIAGKELVVENAEACSNLLDDYGVSYADSENVNARQQSIEMNTMKDITDDSIDYIHLMGQNLDTLRQTLRK